MREFNSDIKNYIKFFNETNNLNEHIKFYNDNIHLCDMQKMSINGRHFHQNVIPLQFNKNPYIPFENNHYFKFLTNENKWNYFEMDKAKNINESIINNINSELILLYNNITHNIKLKDKNSIIYELNNDEYYNVLRFTNYYIYVCFSKITPLKGVVDTDKHYRTKIKNLISPFQIIIENLQFHGLTLKNKIYDITKKY